MTTTVTSHSRRTGWRLIGYLIRRAFWMEVRGYQSIYRFVFRRPKVPRGAVGFSYHQPVMAVLIVLIAVSAVELVAVDIIVARWTHVRISLLVLGIWGLVFMLGLLFGMLTRPHAVGPAGIRVRYGADIDLALPWEDLYSVTRRRQMVQERQPRVTTEASGEATLHLRMQGETNLEIRLERPLAFRLPHGTETVSAVTLYAEDSKGFMNEVRRYL